jgi:hypothetical protein
VILQVIATPLVAYVTIEDEVCTKATPFLSHMVDWTLARVVSYCRLRGWSITEVPAQTPASAPSA